MITAYILVGGIFDQTYYGTYWNQKWLCLWHFFVYTWFKYYCDLFTKYSNEILGVLVTQMFLIQIPPKSLVAYIFDEIFEIYSRDSKFSIIALK